MKEKNKMKNTFWIFALVTFSFFSCFSQKDTFLIKIKREKIFAKELILKNQDLINLAEKAFDITEKSYAKNLDISYSIKLYKQNKNRIIILHLNSDFVNLSDSNFIGGFYNSQGRPIYCFGQETLSLFEDINDCALVSFMSRKYESDEVFRINLIDGTRILEGSTIINGEKFKIITEYIPALY